MGRTTLFQITEPVISPSAAAALHAHDVVPGLPAPENKTFYPALDGIRAAAVLFVFCEHYLTNLGVAFHWGWAGVNVFFVLSGFLITGILYDTRDTAHRFRNFYVRRALRIFPLFYGVLLLALLLTPIFHWIWHPAWILWPLYLGNYGRFIWLHDFNLRTGVLDHLVSSRPFHHPFFLRFGHFWSLCIEEQFYLVWPLVVYHLRSRVKLRNLCLIVWALTPIVRILCIKYFPLSFLQAELLVRIAPTRADSLLLGGAMALMMRGPEASLLPRLLRPLLYLIPAGFVVLQITTRHYTHGFYHAGADWFFAVFALPVIDLFAASVILLSLEPQGHLYRIFTLKPLRRLGQVSYGFYVFHDIPHNAYSYVAVHYLPHYHYLSDVTEAAILALPTTIVLSFLSFRYFESFFLRFKDRYTF